MFYINRERTSLHTIPYIANTLNNSYICLEFHECYNLNHHERTDAVRSQPDRIRSQAARRESGAVYGPEHVETVRRNGWLR